MIQLFIAQAAQQATGIPAEVWVAIIAGVGGFVIKPLMDMLSGKLGERKQQFEETKKQREESHKREVEFLKKELEHLRDEIENVRANASASVLAARDNEDEWREKYFAALEKFSRAYGDEPSQPELDLADPEVLRKIIKQITDG